MTENENLFRQELIEKYKSSFGGLFRYIPWLETKKGSQTAHLYQGEEMGAGSLPVMVYDPMVLSLVKEMQATGLMNRNYVYTYSRRGIHTIAEELKLIEEASLTEIEDIISVLSRYVLGGMTKGRLWTQAVESGVFFYALVKLKDILDIWDEPLA